MCKLGGAGGRFGDYLGVDCANRSPSHLYKGVFVCCRREEPLDVRAELTDKQTCQQTNMKETYRLVQKKGTVLLSSGLAWPAVAGCSRAETFSQLSAISFAQPCISVSNPVGPLRTYFYFECPFPSRHFAAVRAGRDPGVPARLLQHQDLLRRPREGAQEEAHPSQRGLLGAAARGATVGDVQMSSFCHSNEIETKYRFV